MSIYDAPVKTLDGSAVDLHDYEGKALLIVNVASHCGLTPQYTGLQALHDELAGRGLAVLGFPCNQFGAQEPGTPDEIQTFCDTNYAVTFPLFEKIDVNGPGRHPLYEQLGAVEDAEGNAGDVQWNFEKFLVAPDGTVVGRYRPMVAPEDAELRAAIDAVLPT